MQTTVTSKGQVTIPHAIRVKAKIVPGSRLDFQIQDDGSLIAHLMTNDISELKGIVKSKRRKAPSLNEMKKSIAYGATNDRS